MKVLEFDDPAGVSELVSLEEGTSAQFMKSVRIQFPHHYMAKWKSSLVIHSNRYLEVLEDGIPIWYCPTDEIMTEEDLLNMGKDLQNEYSDPTRISFSLKDGPISYLMSEMEED